MKMLVDASLDIPEDAFAPHLQIQFYRSAEEARALLPGQDILFCRSGLRADAGFLAASTLRYVVTASSGSCHIDKHTLHQRGIRLLDAKGCNANAVADYVVCTLASLEYHDRLRPTRAAVVGMGHVGTRVARRLGVLGLPVATIDPPRQASSPYFISDSPDILPQCDLICIHAELHDQPPWPTRKFFDETLLARLAPGTILINAARGGIVDEQALLAQDLVYCTDVYEHEPRPDPRIVEYATRATPHIAGHSVEGRQRAVADSVTALCQALDIPVPPALIPPETVVWPLPEANTWQERALALYDPLNDTMALRKANDKESCFLQLRKTHGPRHDFNTAYMVGVSESEQVLFGTVAASSPA